MEHKTEQYKETGEKPFPPLKPGTLLGRIAELEKIEEEHAQLLLHVRQSEERYRAVVEDQTELICRFLPEGLLTFVNQAYCRYFNKTPEELIGKSFMPLIPEEEIERCREHLLSLDINNPIGTIEHRVIASDGTIGWQSWTDRKIFDDCGNCIEIQAVGRDITERKRMEEALNKYRNALEQKVVERTAELLTRNAQLLKENEERKKVETELCSQTVLLHERLKELNCLFEVCRIIERHKAPLEEIFQEVVNIVPSAFQNPVNVAGRIRFGDATYATAGFRESPLKIVFALCGYKSNMRGSIEVHAFPDKYKSDGDFFLAEEVRVLETIAIHLNELIEHKQAQTTLKNSERRMAEIIDFLPDATFAIDIEGRVIAWNQAIEVMTGVRAEDIIGKGDYEYALPFYQIRRPMMVDLILRPEEEIEKLYNFLHKEENLCIVEQEFLSINGKKLYLWGKASAFYNEEGLVIGAIESIRDIAQRKQAEDELKERERELETKSLYLEEINTALKVLLKRREQDKAEFEENIIANFKELILPHIVYLKKTLSQPDRLARINTIETNLQNILSPFLRNLTLKNYNLTPREIQIASLIKEGKATKDISELLHLSTRAVDFHRNNIRDKLGLRKTKTNLRSFLLSLS